MNNITKLLKEASVYDLRNIVDKKINCDDCPARNYCKTQEDITCEETFREWCLMEE